MKILSVIFFYLISQINGCIDFDQGSCTYDKPLAIYDSYILDCDISNPMLKVNASNCNKTLSTLTMKMKSFDDIETLYSNNQPTFQHLYGFFPDNGTIVCDIILKVSFAPLATLTHYSIDKNKILNLAANGLKCRPIFTFETVSTSWDKINLTINNDVNTITRPHKVIWRFSGGPKRCQFTTESPHLRIETAHEYCRSYFKIIDTSQRENKFHKENLVLFLFFRWNIRTIRSTTKNNI